MPGMVLKLVRRELMTCCRGGDHPIADLFWKLSDEVKTVNFWPELVLQTDVSSLTSLTLAGASNYSFVNWLRFVNEPVFRGPTPSILHPVSPLPSVSSPFDSSNLIFRRRLLALSELAMACSNVIFRCLYRVNSACSNV